MKEKPEIRLINYIQNDSWMLEILTIVKNLQLNDCWIGAGFIRNKVWDVLHAIERTKLNDIDVIYFNADATEKEKVLHIEFFLKTMYPTLNWSVKNQARMHLRNNHQPYLNCHHAISFWPETATAVAVRLNHKNRIEYLAPYGLDDLFNLIVTPTPQFDITVYNQRIQAKAWAKKWNLLIFKKLTP